MIHHAAKVLSGQEYPCTHPGPRLILDIGANCGAFTAYALHRWPGASIVCYEPNPSALYYLRRNFKGHPQVTIIPKAISTAAQVAGIPGKHNQGEYRTVPVDGVLAIDTLHPNTLPQADLIKIDCEGAEWEILPYLEADEIIGEIHLKPCPYPNPYRYLDGAMHAIGAKVRYGPYTGGDETQTFIATRPARPDHERDPSNIFFGIPVHYDPTSQFAALLLGIQREFDGAHIEIWTGDSHPDRARNHIVDKFLKSKKEWLFFLDADLTGSPNLLRRIHASAHTIGTGLYHIKTTTPHSWVANFHLPPYRKRAEAFESGTGTMCVHRSVFERMIKAYPESGFCEKDGSYQYAPFASGSVWDYNNQKRRWLSEDWLFCRRARELGYRIEVFTDCVFGHEGRILYPIPTTQ